MTGTGVALDPGMDRGFAMLRYRFDTFEQLSRHLRISDDAALLFLRDAPAQGRVIVELKVKELSQAAIVRGEVVARERGAWVQLADRRLADRVLARGEFGFRKESRVVADQALLFFSEGATQKAELVDLSEAGLRVRGPAQLPIGSKHLVRTMGGRVSVELGNAHVVRVQGAETGLRFERPGNLQVLRFIRSVKEKWSGAPELDHPKECCTRGAAEPEPPPLHK